MQFTRTIFSKNSTQLISVVKIASTRHRGKMEEYFTSLRNDLIKVIGK